MNNSSNRLFIDWGVVAYEPHSKPGLEIVNRNHTRVNDDDLFDEHFYTSSVVASSASGFTICLSTPLLHAYKGPPSKRKGSMRLPIKDHLIIIQIKRLKMTSVSSVTWSCVAFWMISALDADARHVLTIPGSLELKMGCYSMNNFPI